ncbi:MAG: GTPase ObgE [Parachlamydiaceae bacterium]
MFTDRVIIDLAAGKGGDGVIAWRREKYIPKGGPTGGDGGKGGSLILQADAQIYALDWFRNRRILKADDGQPGGANLCKGKDGKDLLLKVPCGTLVKDADTGEVLRDLTQDGEQWVVCKGGKGGYGNDHFKSPTHRAPYVRTLGEPGQDRQVELELKLIADVGLVGFPNAGKSTLLSTLAQIQLKVAAYPFTTLHPNLSFIENKAGKRVYIADIPGIIEGAHNNRGLGLEFLRHIERTKLLLFLLDASGIDGRTPLSDYAVLRDEIKEYNPELLDRPYLVVLNKIDDEESIPKIEEFLKKSKVPKKLLFQISAVTGEGLEPLVAAIEQNVF